MLAQPEEAIRLEMQGFRDTARNGGEMAENRRVRMTKAMIREAYIDFIVENPDEKPSVTEVCERADVNRSTFYTHYRDLDDLHAEIEASIFEVVPVLAPEDDPDYIDKNCRLLRDFFTFIADDPRLLSVITSTKAEEGLEFKLASVLFRNFRPEGVSREGSQGYYEYVFVIMGALGAMREWHRAGCPIKPDAFGYLMFECCRKAMTNSPDLSALE